MARCLISFGANLGQASNTIRQAAVALEQSLECQSTGFQLSRLYRTPPIGGPAGQPPFVNAVAAISTQRSAWEIWAAVRELERQFGRQRNRRWEARQIDLDILLYDDLRIWTPQLKIPHPRLCMRRFILAPACDVARDWVEPVTGMTIASLAHALQSSPANLSLVASDASVATSILEEASRLSLAHWQTPMELPEKNQSQETQNTLAAPNAPDISRWVTLVSQPELAALAHPAKLVVVLAPPMLAEAVAWEDYHRDLAVALNLIPGEVAQHFWTIHGPRYLLASDDRDWAVHEIVAALDAMDCPVEPIE